MRIIRTILKKVARFFTDCMIKILTLDGRFYKFLSLYYPNSNPIRRVDFLRKFRKINIGKNVYIDESVWRDNEYPQYLFIEDNVVVANGARLLTHDSALNGMYEFPNRVKKTVLKKNCYIGAAAIILPGTTIGENAIIGAGAIVTKNVPPNEVWAGTPAKKIITIKEFYERAKNSKDYSDIKKIKNNYTRPKK